VDGPELGLRTARYASPFDYPRQALLAVPTDVPAPNVDQAGHGAAVMRIVRDVVRAAGGGVFVLVTSHRDVRALAEGLRRDDPDSSVAELLVHGDGPRDALLRRFRESGNAVLVGTASFWEGVDVPGRALRALVIARLPFRVPTEPVTAAQCERIAARGGDPFAEYMLPQASLRLNQGFGRLIRSASDRGVVVIADPRAATKVYGRGLLDALPPARRLIGPWPVVQRHVESFFHSEPRTP
jgi:ATP-dependent DNA helicase DinG